MSDQESLQPEALTEITGAYLRALGRITVEFSRLESTLLSGCAVLLGTNDTTRAFIVISQLPFKGLLSAFCLLLGQEFRGQESVIRATKAFQKAAARAEDLRNQAAHSIWALPRSVPGRAVRRKFRVTQKPAYHQEVHAMSVEEVNAIADEIAVALDAAAPLFKALFERGKA